MNAAIATNSLPFVPSPSLAPFSLVGATDIPQKPRPHCATLKAQTGFNEITFCNHAAVQHNQILVQMAQGFWEWFPLPCSRASLNATDDVYLYLAQDIYDFAKRQGDVCLSDLHRAGWIGFQTQNYISTALFIAISILEAEEHGARL